MKTRIILLILALSLCSVWAADITGVWKAQFDTQRGLQKYTFTLRQDGTKVHRKRQRRGEWRETRIRG